MLFRSTEHPNCGRQKGYVRAFIESKLLSEHLKSCINLPAEIDQDRRRRDSILVP